MNHNVKTTYHVKKTYTKQQLTTIAIQHSKTLLVRALSTMATHAYILDQSHDEHQCDILDLHKCKDVALCSLWVDAHAVVSINLCLHMRSFITREQKRLYPIDMVSYRLRRMEGCFMKRMRFNGICCRICCRLASSVYQHHTKLIYLCEPCKMLGFKLLCIDIIIVMSKFNIPLEVTSHAISLIDPR